MQTDEIIERVPSEATSLVDENSKARDDLMLGIYDMKGERRYE
jgi:hypothetical protein